MRSATRSEAKPTSTARPLSEGRKYWSERLPISTKLSTDARQNPKMIRYMR